MAIVYRHIRLDKNEPFYIGIGKSIERAYTKQGRSFHWKNIIKNCEYDVQILFDDLSWSDACEKEKEFIKLYGRIDLKTGTLVNLTDGGEGIRNVSEESKNKLRKYRLGTHLSDETKQKISKSNMGKIYSYETRKKISENNINGISGMKGKHHSEATKKIFSENCVNGITGMKGKYHSQETKDKISKSREKYVGENHPMFGKIGGMNGKKHTNESIEKMRKPKSEKTKENMRLGWIKRKLKNI